MLTADLLRATIRKGAVKPTWLKGKNDRARQYASSLIAIYERGVGAAREELELEIAELIGDSPDFLLARGLAKLLDDRSTFSAEVEVEPEALRSSIYDEAFGVREDGRRPSRGEVIAVVADRFGIAEEALERLMFADLRSQEVLQAFRPIEVDALLARYDVALAQAVLLRATELTLRVERATPGQLRAIFRALKFHQLLFEASRDAADAWLIRIDGPLNILQRSGRYGVQLAQAFIPMLHLERWSLNAELRWPGKDEPLSFRVGHEDRLIPIGRLQGAWVSAEQELLVSRIRESDAGWSVVDDVEIVDLAGRDVLIPELILRHDDGREALVEIVGTWRRAWLERHVDQLRRFGPPHLVLCVSKTLAAQKELVDGIDDGIVVFSAVIPMAKVLAAAARVAR